MTRRALQITPANSVPSTACAPSGPGRSESGPHWGVPCAQKPVHIPSRTCALLLLVDVLVSRGRPHVLALQTRPRPSTAPAITQQVSPGQDLLLNVMFVDLTLLPGSQSPSLPSDIRALPCCPIHHHPNMVRAHDPARTISSESCVHCLTVWWDFAHPCRLGTVNTQHRRCCLLWGKQKEAGHCPLRSESHVMSVCVSLEDRDSVSQIFIMQVLLRPLGAEQAFRRSCYYKRRISKH